MIKRILCVICAVLVMLTLSVFVLSDVPRNNVRGSLNITSSVSYIEGSPLTINFDDVSIPFGTTKLFDVYYRPGNGQTFYSDSTVLKGNFNLVVTEPCSLYLCVNNDSDTVFSYDNVSSQLSSYRDSANDIYTEYIVPDTHISLFIQSTNGSYVLNPDANAFAGEQYPVVYQAFSNVPAGTYNLDFVYQRNPAAPNYYCYFILGVYSVGLSPVDKYESGQITFDQALNSIISDMQTKLDEITSSDVVDYNQAQFVVSYAEYEIERIEHISDVRYNTTVSDFNDQGEVIIDSFILSDSQDVSTYISSLTNLFSSVLEQASSAEQGTFLSSCFQNLLAKLQLAYEMSLYDVVSDEEMEENAADKSYLKDLFADEDEAIEMFDRAQYESMLDFNEWISELKNYQQYRNIFEWFFSSSGDLRVFILMPFCFVLVSLLLGTTTVLVASERIRVRDEMRANLAVKKDYYNTRIKFYKSKMK